MITRDGESYPLPCMQDNPITWVKNDGGLLE